MKQIILPAAVLAVSSAMFLGAGEARANELGGVNFEWTKFVPDDYEGRFINHNPTCKLVTWNSFTIDGQPLGFAGTSRIDGNSALDVRIPSDRGSADVRMFNVKDC